MPVSLRYNFNDLTRLQELGNRLARKAGDTKSLMAAVATVLKRGTQDRFESKTTPDGRPWTSSLFKTGALKRKIIANYDADKAEVGSNLKYAAIHQFGGVIRLRGGIIRAKKAKCLHFLINGQDVFAKSVNMPARTIKIKANPYLGISKADEMAVCQAAETYLAEELK